MSDKYLIESELREVATVLEFLNTKSGKSDLFLDNITVSDSNGDTMGRIQICDSGEYAFYLDAKDD